MRQINGQLTLRYDARGLTSFAGLEQIGRFIRQPDLFRALRRIRCVLPRSDFAEDWMSLLVRGLGGCVMYVI